MSCRGGGGQVSRFGQVNASQGQTGTHCCKHAAVKVLSGHRGLKLKSSYATYPTSNVKSLACDTANEHALTCTRETCSCSQTAVQWNQSR